MKTEQKARRILASPKGRAIRELLIMRDYGNKTESKRARRDLLWADAEDVLQVECARGIIQEDT